MPAIHSSAATGATDRTADPRSASAEGGLVTIVIPTHNRSALLDRALSSALRQTYTKLEVVVVDDASSDDTAAVLGRIEDPRVRVLRHANRRGGAAARNTGIRAARGEFIAFLDDDDEWMPDKLSRQVLALDGWDAVVCAALVNGVRPTRCYRHERIQPRALRRGYLGGGTSSLLVRRDVLAGSLFDESLPLGQDWDLLVRLCAQCRVRYLPMPLVRFNDGDHERITTSARTASVEEIEKRLLVYRKHRSFLGPFWFRFHTASLLLYRVRERNDALGRLVYTWRRCGASAVLAYYLRQAWSRAVAGAWGRQR